MKAVFRLMAGILFYAVANGRKPGIYKTWEACQEQVSGFSKAKFKKFPSLSEAEHFIKKHLESLNLESRNVRVSTPEKQQDSSQGQKLESISPDVLSSTNEGNSLVTQELNPNLCSANDRIIDIYVDGACRGNGKTNRDILPSGYGVYYGPDHPLNSAVSLTTVDNVKKNRASNQRAELFAISHALDDIYKLHADPLFADARFIIHTDSQYAKKCLTIWAESWRKNNWMTSAGRQVLNLDIVIRSYRLFSKLNLQRKDLVRISHVKGHLNIEGNEAADRLANIGADKMEHILKGA